MKHEIYIINIEHSIMNICIHDRLSETHPQATQQFMMQFTVVSSTDSVSYENGISTIGCAL